MVFPKIRGGFPAAVFFLFFGILAAAAQDVPTRTIADDSGLRAGLMDSWLTDAPGRVLAKGSALYRLPGGDYIEVRSEAGRDEFMVILARGRDGSYPGWIQGSWILTRSMTDGAPLRIRVFLRSDPYTYVQFRPLGDDRSQMDVVLYEGYVVRSLPLAIPFRRLLSAPVEEALAAAEGKFPRRYFDPVPGLYRDITAFTTNVRERLPELSFRDDGAIDENGQYVFIHTLKPQDGTEGVNCSGFAKWIVDGILRPVTGERLSIAPLKEPYGERGSSLTEPYEELRDPFFGLDWTRNLAAAGSRLRSPSFAYLDEIEVRSAHVATVTVREQGLSRLRAYPGFLHNAGYGVEGLHSLLYTLAIDEPGRIYLASVNNEIGPAPRMRQHFHVAVLVPYFTEEGIFRITVFESAEETSFTKFKNRYPGNFVNLVRVPVESSFDP
ncbi:hypothetical protein [Breznakiella homolactica]|uniref:SH3 domain-containing protein n=1 Tax=Breznakiella homolactica TaxID=2798577 RepID=A0A7T8BAI1_9SPIR|nr:hypothetical protein [Breznakiella homolactica]QQO09035.1 hypothetical protein JFL75_19220 [Breznakiella homolactica]